MRVLIACEYSGTVRDAFAKKGHQAVSCDLLPSEKAGLHFQGPVEYLLGGWMPVSFSDECRLNEGSFCEKTQKDCNDCECIGPTQEGVEYTEIDGFLLGRPQKHPHWDLMIAHPPCTYLCNSGLHWNKRVSGRQEQTEKALEFVRLLMDAPINKIAIENPIGCISTKIRKFDQIIQPWQFGADASKATCFWLKNLPKLFPTKIIEPRIVNGKKRWSNQTDSGQNKLPPSPDRWKIRSTTFLGVAEAMAEQWGNTL